jgi:thioredoxin-related protein
MSWINTRRQHLINAIISVAFSAYSMPASSQNRSKNSLLPLPSDLAQAARAAAQSGQPIVIMVSLPGCPWCELLRRNYLAPMRAEGLPAFEFMVNDRSSALRDFQSKSLSPEALARQWKISSTPTVLFFDQ